MCGGGAIPTGTVTSMTESAPLVSSALAFTSYRPPSIPIASPSPGRRTTILSPIATLPDPNGRGTRPPPPAAPVRNASQWPACAPPAGPTVEPDAHPAGPPQPAWWPLLLHPLEPAQQQSYAVPGPTLWGLAV